MTSCPTALRLSMSLLNYLPSNGVRFPYDHIRPPQITTVKLSFCVKTRSRGAPLIGEKLKLEMQWSVGNTHEAVYLRRLWIQAIPLPSLR
jgi:hypothetical protein